MWDDVIPRYIHSWLMIKDGFGRGYLFDNH